MPSLPASDGFQNPVQSSGLNSKICNPTNQLLDRSVSAPASVCSSESSLTEPIDPRAVKSLESSTECQITPEEEHPLLSQHLSSSASLTNNDPSPRPGEKQQAGNRSGSNLNLDAFSMEVESLKSPSSLSDPLSIGDVPQSESTSEIPAKCTNQLVAEGSSSPSSIHQLDMDPGRPSEERCFSLASALKELHKLLVISRRGENKILASEEASQLEMAHKGPAAQQKELSEDKQKGLNPASQEQSCSLYENPPAACSGLASGASAFPAADVDRILGAGFTMREALEALEQADGNADLALLILLAKSIVVPT
ncbi:PREDICTED: regulatory solute carrier protein family 1 member 1 [Nestor notabilis]|uniref:regulatory solute carrier protein family 1 member 1 n=1 Tax=Nestor notabilis TaxID=176057 RepID=UPI0005237E89|nr:PREDICTED: regulatory solute carrier protein family 1 member 1 [Nestor notabilis]